MRSPRRAMPTVLAKRGELAFALGDLSNRQPEAARNFPSVKKTNSASGSMPVVTVATVPSRKLRAMVQGKSLTKAGWVAGIAGGFAAAGRCRDDP